MLETLRNIYLNSFFYDKKISKPFQGSFQYKPSTYLLSSIIKIQIKKININEFKLENVWTNKSLNSKQFRKLNNFFWIFSLDLKSSSLDVQRIIENWIENNKKYNSRSWDINTTSKRVISWLSNSKLTYDNASKKYKDNFDSILQKQILHLLNLLKISKNYNDKITGIAAVIIFSLCYNKQEKILSISLDHLKKTLKDSLDKNGFPKSRSIKQSTLYFKYLILIREWFKECQMTVPEFIDENIFYLGQSYSFFWKNINFYPLFNGNNNSNNQEFDQYLKRLGYSFKNENYENSNYLSLYNKKINLFMDIGSSPDKKFSSEYQAGALSFEFVSNGKKLFTNGGYYQKKNSELNKLSRSSAIHNTLVIDDNSSCSFVNKQNDKFEIIDDLNITKKKIIFEKNYWKVNAAHDGFLKKYNLIFEREIEFYPESFRLIGTDKIIGKKNLPNLKFDIRFHLDPSSKVMKTQDNKSILIEINDEGWKFNCSNYEIDIDNGLYFGKKNTYIENQNIFISGIINSQKSDINWELVRI
tara:strand:+ start:1223 stop:2806 length:1584 start_codon:yes stop_codon:yes gene_type:complete